MSGAHAIALPAGYRLDNCRFQCVLGHGGFGITYRALDEDLQQVVAIKEYLPREVAFRDQDSTVIPLGDSDRETFEWGLERFLDEARTLARFRHPNIVGVRRFIRTNGTAYLVMDYCEGESLENVLVRQNALSPAQIELLLDPLLGALESLHDAGVTHRDIKPGNIYLREDGSPILLDFGAARQALAQHSRSVTAMATPGYAAFEQYSTNGKQGPWTDIYGLGATLYRCVTGQRPQDAPDRMLEDILKPATEKVAGQYPDSLLQQIDAALKLRPKDRPQDVVEWRGIPNQKATPIILSEPRIQHPQDTLVAGRYRVLGEHGEIIEDIETGLQWGRCSLGQRWDGLSCVGEAERYKWQKVADDTTGWRLPTIEELRTLVHCSRGYSVFGDNDGCKMLSHKPTIVQEAFPNTPKDSFWSSSPNNQFTAWSVDFSCGTFRVRFRGSRLRVRLVRGGQ